ncbi:MAG: hypothetical protein AB2A00_09280 [Myxococcota bacterium]
MEAVAVVLLWLPVVAERLDEADDAALVEVVPPVPEEEEEELAEDPTPPASGEPT